MSNEQNCVFRHLRKFGFIRTAITETPNICFPTFSTPLSDVPQPFPLSEDAHNCGILDNAVSTEKW